MEKEVDLEKERLEKERLEKEEKKLRAVMDQLAGAISRTSVANFIRYVPNSRPMMPKPIRGTEYAQITPVDRCSTPASPAAVADRSCRRLSGEDCSVTRRLGLH